MVYMIPIQKKIQVHLSMKRFKAQDTDEIASLTPHYIRKSDAELKFDNSYSC